MVRGGRKNGAEEALVVVRIEDFFNEDTSCVIIVQEKPLHFKQNPLPKRDVPPIIWTPELLGVFLLSKLTRQQKLDIYAKRQAGHTISQLALEYGINKSGIEYLCRLIDKHSPDILRQDKNRYYSSSLKLQIINRVLIDHQGIRSTAIEFGLPDPGLLRSWIRSYKANGYVIIEKKRGRPTTMKQHPKPSIKPYDDMTPEEKVKYLEEKNLYLEAENAYLKKLRAVVQARKEREQKKK